MAAKKQVPKFSTSIVIPVDLKERIIREAEATRRSQSAMMLLLWEEALARRNIANKEARKR